MTDILVVTGLSGGGRSQAADDLEDMGWFVVDNLPVVLIDKVVELSGEAGGEIGKLCLVVGNARQQAGILGAVGVLRSQGHRVRILFLEASTRELVRRYEATRRKHPLSDTTGLTVHQLKSQLVQLFGPDNPSDSMQVSVLSFGFKHGVPIDVDMVFDVRFLPNPHWDEALRPFSGLDEPVKDYVFSQEVTGQFMEHVDNLLKLILPAYVQEGRSYLTIGIGCTGGRHRSVAIAEALGLSIAAHGYRPRVSHRDINA